MPTSHIRNIPSYLRWWMRSPKVRKKDSEIFYKNEGVSKKGKSVKRGKKLDSFNCLEYKAYIAIL